jgi:hypothetical protein
MPFLQFTNLPHGHEPFVETDSATFHDRSGLGGKLAAAVARAVLPAVVLVLRLEDYMVGTTPGKLKAVRSAARYQELAAVVGIREVYDCFLKGGWFDCHPSTIDRMSCQVIYCP